MNDKPPVIPPPIRQPAPSPEKYRWPLLAKVVLVLVALVTAYFAVAITYMTIQMIRHPIPAAPGEAEFDEANRRIISNRGRVAFGNNDEAVALARTYADSFKIVREKYFTKSDKDNFSLTDGEFLTYCQLNDDSCVFLVHVPDLRHFTRDAQETLAMVAWVNAQMILKAQTRTPPKTVVVGMKGAMLYDAILIGDFVLDPKTEDEGIRTRGSGITDMKLLYPYFAAKEDREKK